MTHISLAGYLEDEYLVDDYLLQIDGEDTGMQATQQETEDVGMQVTAIIYNNSALRVMTEFPSRGTPAQLGMNWTTNSQATGDFNINNINTDIPEQVYRSQVDTNVQMTCDTGLTQGVFLDTLAILNHNFTKSASVILQGATNPGFSPVGLQITLSVELNNMFYIAPTIPLTGFRYWRILIDDATNPAGYVQVGIVIFGASRIFSIAECFENPIREGKRHFKNVITTEGFTNVMNDRALRKFIGMTFNRLDNSFGNFTILNDVIDFAKTSLKCLWIPKPLTPSRYAIFGKLSDLPNIDTIDNEDEGIYSSLSIEIDDSK